MSAIEAVSEAMKQFAVHLQHLGAGAAVLVRPSHVVLLLLYEQHSDDEVREWARTSDPQQLMPPCAVIMLRVDVDERDARAFVYARPESNPRGIKEFVDLARFWLHLEIGTMNKAGEIDPRALMELN